MLPSRRYTQIVGEIYIPEVAANKPVPVEAVYCPGQENKYCTDSSSLIHSNGDLHLGESNSNGLSELSLISLVGPYWNGIRMSHSDCPLK